MDRFPQRNKRLIQDHDYLIARDFQVDTFPTVLLTDPNGKIQRIWTNLQLYSGKSWETPAPAKTTAATLASVPATAVEDPGEP
jgi:hypothetical protein